MGVPKMPVHLPVTDPAVGATDPSLSDTEVGDTTRSETPGGRRMIHALVVSVGTFSVSTLILAAIKKGNP